MERLHSEDSTLSELMSEDPVRLALCRLSNLIHNGSSPGSLGRNLYCIVKICSDNYCTNTTKFRPEKNFVLLQQFFSHFYDYAYRVLLPNNI